MSRVKPNLEEGAYLSRRTKIIRQIKGEAALFVAAPELTYNRDQHAPFKQNSDFLYLTGFDEPESALLLLGSSQGPRSVLYVRERDPVHEQWQGERLGTKRARRRFQVDEVRDIRTLHQDLPKHLTNCRVLHFTPGVNPEHDSVVWQQFCTSIAPRLQFPNVLKDARLMTSEMRFFKDRIEVQALRHAADITARAFLMLLPRIKEMTSERHAATLLESYFAKLGAHGVSFSTIVASGKNATTLHHSPQHQPLWKRELVLIDAGASFRGYAGDITRTVPASGKFSPAQADVYDVVHAALEAATAKARPESSLDDVHDAAVRELTRGLIDLRILKGSVPENVSQGKYKKYYMHRTGHWLGLDVHDIAPVSHTGATGTTLFVPPSMRPLQPGNAFTVEPGLYFDPRDTSIPPAFRGIGIRIEDDVLITAAGCEVLTAKIPSTRPELEALMA